MSLLIPSAVIERIVVTFSKSTKVASQVTVVKKIFGTLVFIGKRIEYKNWNIVMQITGHWCDHTWDAICCSVHPAIGRM